MVRALNATEDEKALSVDIRSSRRSPGWQKPCSWKRSAQTDAGMCLKWLPVDSEMRDKDCGTISQLCLGLSQ